MTTFWPTANAAAPCSAACRSATGPWWIRAPSAPSGAASLLSTVWPGPSSIDRDAGAERFDLVRFRAGSRTISDELETTSRSTGSNTLTVSRRIQAFHGATET